MHKPNLILIGDSPTSNTGFGRVVRALSTRWASSGAFNQIICYGITYNKEPHDLPMLIVPGREFWATCEGQEQLRQFLHGIRGESVIWILHDLWRVAVMEADVLPKHIPTILYFPVDGIQPLGAVFPLHKKNLRAITYTKYGVDQIKKQFNVDINYIHHGIDFSPETRKTKNKDDKGPDLESREFLYNNFVGKEDFLISYVATNSCRKDPLAALEIFKRLKSKTKKNLKLYMHMYSNAEMVGGYNLSECTWQLGLNEDVMYGDRWFDLKKSLICQAPDEVVRAIYKTSNLCINTSVGEGWCMPIQEAMSLGVPCAAPRHTAFSSLYSDKDLIFLPISRDGHHLLPGDRGILRPRVSIAGAADAVGSAIEKDLSKIAETGKLSVTRPEQSWDNIAVQWLKLFHSMELI